MLLSNDMKRKVKRLQEILNATIDTYPDASWSQWHMPHCAAYINGVPARDGLMGHVHSTDAELILSLESWNTPRSKFLARAYVVAMLIPVAFPPTDPQVVQWMYAGLIGYNSSDHVAMAPVKVEPKKRIL